MKRLKIKKFNETKFESKEVEISNCILFLFSHQKAASKVFSLIATQYKKDNNLV